LHISGPNRREKGKGVLSGSVTYSCFGAVGRGRKPSAKKGEINFPDSVRFEKGGRRGGRLRLRAFGRRSGGEGNVVTLLTELYVRVL